MSRSVAEIIGWRIEDNPWYNERTAYREERQRLVTPDGECWLTSKTPDADDLLAWLREQGYHAEMFAGVGGESTVTLWAYVSSVRLDSYTFTALTLLAALERAVLAVAGES